MISTQVKVTKCKADKCMYISMGTKEHNRTNLKSITGLINIVVQKKGKRDNLILKALVQRKYPKLNSDHG